MACGLESNPASAAAAAATASAAHRVDWDGIVGAEAEGKPSRYRYWMADTQATTAAPTAAIRAPTTAVTCVDLAAAQETLVRTDPSFAGPFPPFHRRLYWPLPADMIWPHRAGMVCCSRGGLSSLRFAFRHPGPLPTWSPPPTRREQD